MVVSALNWRATACALHRDWMENAFRASKQTRPRRSVLAPSNRGGGRTQVPSSLGLKRPVFAREAAAWHRLIRMKHGWWCRGLASERLQSNRYDRSALNSRAAARALHGKWIVQARRASNEDGGGVPQLRGRPPPLQPLWHFWPRTGRRQRAPATTNGWRKHAARENEPDGGVAFAGNTTVACCGPASERLTSNRYGRLGPVQAGGCVRPPLRVNGARGVVLMYCWPCIGGRLRAPFTTIGWCKHAA